MLKNIVRKAGSQLLHQNPFTKRHA